MMKKIRKELLSALMNKAEKQLPMTLVEYVIGNFREILYYIKNSGYLCTCVQKQPLMRFANSC